MFNVVENDPFLTLFSHFMSKELGHSPLDEIVAFTADYFNVEYVHIALLQNDQSSVEVVAAYFEGKLMKSGYIYPLSETPCHDVMQNHHRCYSEHVQELFPHDADLVSLQAESYVGEPILNNEGIPIGLIVMVSQNKFPSFDLLASLMQMVAGRSGIELSRQSIESTLRKEHENLQMILDYAPIGIWLQDGKGKIGFVNKAFTQAVGISEETFLEVDHYIELIPEEFKPQCVASDAKALASKDISITYQQLPFVDGNTHDLKVIKAVKRDEQGSPIALIGLSMDITDELRHQAQLRENQQLLNTVIDEMPDILVLKDEKGNFILCNESVAKLYNTTPEEMIGKHDGDFGVSSKLAEEFRSNVLEIMAEGKTRVVMEQSRDATTGKLHHFRSIKKPFKDSDGKDRILVIATDITDIVESQKKVAESEHLLQEIMGIAKEGIWDWHILSGNVFHNQEWYEILKATPDEIAETAEAFIELLHPDDKAIVMTRLESLLKGERDRYSSEHRLIRHDGSIIWVQDRGQIIEWDENGAPIRIVGAFTDITDQKKYENELERIAHYDTLTGLPNRILNADRLTQAMLQSLRREKIVAIIYLDLDGFKPINDTYGHDTGDLMLIEVAKKISYSLREEDTLSRLGGDEFIILLSDLSSTVQAITIINRILDSFHYPIEIDEKILSITASIGVTFYPQAEEVDGDQLIRQADLAMYTAKQAGKNRFHIFDAAHDQTIRTRHQSLQKIKDALEHKEFVLYYQPKVNMETREIMGAEALIRWNSPQNGLLYPMEFLPMIEDEAISIDIGEWVISEALSRIPEFQEHGLDITISVNVGAKQLLNGHFPERLEYLFHNNPLIDPNRLEIEILETSALEDLNTAVSVIQRCVDLGVNFSLDDFGTGYSSLSYLKRLPISTLKIDQSFVKDINGNSDDHVIVQGIIGLANAFGKKVIAEGVETDSLAKKLVIMGCEMGQGYGIGRPMELKQFFQWAVEWKENSR